MKRTEIGPVPDVAGEPPPQRHLIKKAAIRTTKFALKAGAAIAAGKAKKTAARGLQQLAVAVDEGLMRAGRAAARRQHKRAVKARLKAAGKVALVAGGAVAVIGAARVINARRRSAPAQS
jgi:hypothetical protein